MQVNRLALIVSAVVLAACSGGDATKDSTAAATPTDTTKAPATGAPTGAPATGTAAYAAPTGQTHEVKMYGDEKGYRFEPADITVKAGDGIKFVMVNGGPHNVAFDPATIPADSKDQLNANMQQATSELSSPMLMNPNEAYVISFTNVKPGKYPYHCTPHLAMNMRGTVTVQ
jgi:plastocyanin